MKLDGRSDEALEHSVDDMSDEALLLALGKQARAEELAAAHLAKPGDGDVDQINARVLSHLQQAQRHRSWLRSALKRFKVWFSVPLILAVAGWLLWWPRQVETGLPMYQLEVLDSGGTLRGTAETQATRPTAVRAGTRAALVLRPHTATAQAPLVEVWLEAGEHKLLLPAELERDPLGAVRIEVSVPERAGKLLVRFGESLPAAMRASSKQHAVQQWTLPITPGH